MPMARRAITALLSTVLLFVSCDLRQEEPAPPERDTVAEAVKLFKSGSYRKAEDQFSGMLPTLKGRARDLAKAHFYLARIAFVSGRFDAAIEHADQAITASREARDYRGEAAYRILRGDVLADLSEHAMAKESYAKALSLYSAFNDRREQSRTLLRMARSSLIEGRSQDALEQYQNALTLSAQDGVALETAEGLSGLAQAYYLQHRYSESASTFAQADEIAAGSGNLQAQIRLGWVRSLRKLGDVAGASALLDDEIGQEEEPSGESVLPLVFLERSLLAQEQGRLDEARRTLDEALRLAEQVGDQIAVHYLTLFRIRMSERSIPPNDRSGRLSQLAREYTDVAERFALIDNRTGEAYARIRKAQLLRRMNQLAEARSDYAAALAVEDSRLGEYMNPERHLPYLEKLGIGAVREQWYFDYASLLVQLNDPQGALVVMERARLKRQFTVLRRTPPRLQNLPVQAEVDSLTRLVTYMTSLQREISGMLARRPLLVLPQYVGELKKELKALERDAGALCSVINAKFPNYAPAVYMGKVPDIDLQPMIPQGTVIVQYLVGDEQLIILALTNRRLEVRRSPVSREKLSGLLGEYVTLMQDPNVYAGAGGEASVAPMLRFATISPQLYNLLFKPVESLFGDRVVLVPDGMFEGFPLHALEQQNPGGDIRYLIEIVSVEYASSLTSLAYRSIEARPVRRVSGIGNPTGKDWSIDYELRDLRSFFKDAEIYTGIDATWSRLQSTSADLLILSTEFQNPVPDQSFGTIGFSDGTTSGELQFEPFERLAELRPAPVVLLSNHSQSGAGLRPDHANLVRLRGTPDVFINAWPADRKAAKFFSEFFVTHLANDLTPAEAFRQTLLNFIRIRDVQHPRSWGQFFYFGGI